MEDKQWQAPVLGEDGKVKREEPPLTITGLLREAAQRPPSTSSALSLVLTDHELADAGIPVTVRNGAGLGHPVRPFAEPKESGVPPAPPGVRVDDNMRRARQLQETIMNGMPGDMPPPDPSYGIMTAWFPKGAEMDYKKDGKQYDDFGNFNYGAVGSTLGIGPTVLHGAAGLAQIKDKTWNPRFGLPFLTGSFGDDPDDVKLVDRGIAYAKEQRPK